MSLPLIRDRSCGIRFESLGGLGADAAAQALAATAVVKLGLDGTLLSSHRLERKGARVRSFVSLAPLGRPARTIAAMDAPDAIVVFHPALLRDPQTFAGLRRDGVFLYGAPPKAVPDELAALPAAARPLRVDAAGIAAKEKCGIEAALLGALCAALELAEAGAVLATYLDALPASVRDASAKAFERGAKEMEKLGEVGRAAGDLPPSPGKEPAEGADSGGIRTHAGDTIWNDVSAARAGSLPAFNRERCIHCALCDMVCPDACLVWEKGEEGGRFERELTGIDYRYCKGCMRCVESCPASAMLKKAETAAFAQQRTVPLYPDIVE